MKNVLNHFCIYIVSGLNTLCAFNPSSEANNALYFTQNKGQISDQFFKPRPDILYSGSNNQITFHLKSNGISYQLHNIQYLQNKNLQKGISAHLNTKINRGPVQMEIYRLDVSWLNCNNHASIETQGEREGVENYYSEACPEGVVGVKSYKKLLYHDIYDGIDLKWYEYNGQLKYDYLVAAATDYRQIKWEVNGAESIGLDKNGNLIVKTPLGDLVEEAPSVMQNGRYLKAAWVITNNIISFDIKGIDPSKPFVIDPLVRLWGTYYGGNGADFFISSCTDNSDNIYTVGQTQTPTSQNIATVGGHQTTYGGPGTLTYLGDGFAVKFSPQGTRLWATYYGGSGYDAIIYCATDVAGNIYLTGSTNSTNTNVIATPGAYQTAFSGNTSNGGDVFLVKFNANGVRQWGTYYGDTLDDWGLGVCLSPAGEPIITGGTYGNTANNVFGTAGSHQPLHAVAPGYNYDGFLAKFSSAGSRLWSTYYGGSEADYGEALRVDANGDIFLVGETATAVSSVIATMGCHQYGIGSTFSTDAFIAKFTGTGNRIWASYYGGMNQDYAVSCSLDKLGNVYMTGATASPTGIATPGSHQPNYVQSRDLYVVKFNNSGIRQWATYYGGMGLDDWAGSAVDSKGNLYLCGLTASSSGTVIATACSYQPQYGGGPFDCFLAKFDSSGTRLWGTYYGGNGDESGGGSTYGLYGSNVCVDTQDNIYLAGTVNQTTNSMVIASPGAYQPAFNGGSRDAFLVKFDGCRGVALPSANSLTLCYGKTASISTTPACATYWYSGATGNNLLFPGTLFTGPLTHDTTFFAEDLLCGPGLPRTAVTLTVIPGPVINVSASSYTVCAGESVTLSATGALSYSWAPGIAVVSTSAAVIPTITTTYSSTGTGTNGCPTAATVQVATNVCLGIKNELLESDQLYIYPNPNNGEFTIIASKEQELSMFNNLGQLVAVISLTQNKEFKAELNNMTPGIYFVRSNALNKLSAQKIVINK
ncbi:MAG: T9SS type A sorting domain-containing protein [Bacteroidia bacterium]|nr:T9SS type A sorting domain-containing protein [Bacteroidia bacterium]